ncbi:DUF6596 domain-containing protein [Lapillicoccus sp.]|uniref:RNA polymerase sigma factor n=1 Tax=Lapillicoccus sp. TaxID=1909287 RepID=UPI0032651BB8
MGSTSLDDVWRRETPHVVAALARRHGDFDGAEEATQEALLAAARQWPREGVPDNPRGWLIRVASRRLVDQWRSDAAREKRELAVTIQQGTPLLVAPAAGGDSGAEGDDTLLLLLLCCHPVLSPPSRVALTLRAVGGLSTGQIAAAFLVPESTMAQRISRAKATLRDSGARFMTPDGEAPADLPDRLVAVMHVLYLVFNEGYATSRGAELVDVSLTKEAIRLARRLHGAVSDPAKGVDRAEAAEAAGLLALMLLTDARRPARIDAAGDLVPLEYQDRRRWDRCAIAEGVALVEAVLPHGRVGPFQLQAAIAAVHDESPTWGDTDWLQIAMLYRMLAGIAPNPATTLGLAVAVGMAHGPDAGLEVLRPLENRPDLANHHRLHAVRAHLLDMAGRHEEAVEAYRLAARLTASIPEQRYLNARAASSHAG